ncbi:phosphoenolpyruvate carboxykinase [Methylorubrum extorquens]|uniref:phosphoenolpyruvate carboxykinase n=1 Tax=Methylorubrum extorquens TaxID=408 RepID=UPI00209D2362|nr:phosphoenolpyruvate carboxykinase [Methylorubrum extorquens]MCP1560712.1 phosphoenolpyruvate carboxykinase (ATP) [Methylorubrum extorquens]MDF9866088.1 phosphoenolpyruvate carboxykinase (ATP) [Methylorubrum pseudosasae]MDH6639639.1 phosphoenolpyruvate carboxykinase (ATP) [Methylobacterium sp. SuP10 SLI 274]MDH6668832.1 phosphoenolpyruvate carboxykinase (ATP) [Methylorubrum zatmanii]
MKTIGEFNAAHGPEAIGLTDLAAVHWNLEAPRLYEEALRRNEAQLARGGALVATTGSHTGRSPKDKYVVRDAGTENEIWWDNNGSITPDQFATLLDDFRAHARGKELFAQDLFGGADPAHRVRARVYTELAWHSLFIRNLLIRPERADLAAYVPELTIIDLPSFQADPARHGCRSKTVIAIDFSQKIVLIGGSAYAGEMKKSVFTYLNYVLPGAGVMPMHCSANASLDETGDSALFFGLSGTGKTTLSNDSSRQLIGDDEHGWSRDGIFNFEGGCYAKTIRLSRNAEPEIYATTERFGTVMENVVIDPLTRVPDFDDASLTENTRCAYPLDFIANASATGRAGHPKNIVMLTCDAFGVMPPIAKLTGAEAMYHFLSGYTAKVAGTERGLTAPEATFSTCFGAPFMPRHPSVYGNLLRELMAEHGVDCWLVNTGWTGGGVGTGRRMPIRVTRRLLSAALDGSLAQVEFRRDPYFGFSVPVEVPGVETQVLSPVETWTNKAAFADTATRLVTMFRENFKRFESHVDADVRAAEPVAAAIAA